MNVQLRKQEPEPAQTPGLTGVPVQRRLDPERRGGQSFDDVRVRYNSQPEREAGLGPEQCMPAPALWGVIQMALPVIPRQSGCNCGYHALARALIQFDGEHCGNPADLERRLASFAIVKGYSVIGEAFDPYTLAGVGNSFCAENNISAQCVYREFKDEAELSSILTEAQTSGSVILFPYFPDRPRTLKSFFGPGVNPDNKDNAHWGALEPQGDSAMLYEGNFRGSSPKAGEEATLPPLEVTPGAMFSSNQSILSEFDWDNFLEKMTLDKVNAAKKNVVVAPEAPNSGPFDDKVAFTQQVRQVMEKIAALPQGQLIASVPVLHTESASLVSHTSKDISSPAPVQPVSLGGALVEVRRG